MSHTRPRHVRVTTTLAGVTDPSSHDPWGNPIPPTSLPTEAMEPAGSARTEGTAIGSLVCAVIGLACAGVILEPLAIILGFRARRKIAASQGALKGENLAMAGIVVGFVGLALAIIGIVLLVRNPQMFDDLIPTTTTAGV